MIKPTEACIAYAKRTNAEIWFDEDETFFVVYPTAREAHAHSRDVLGFTEMYDVGAFEVSAICTSVLTNLSCARRIL